MNVIRFHLRAVCALLSASVIICSSILTPVNVFADADVEPSAETSQETTTTTPPPAIEPPPADPSIASTPTANETPEATPAIIGDEPAIELTNTAEVTNHVDQDATSGDATIAGNESINDISTGPASGTTLIVNDATTVASIDGGDSVAINTVTSPSGSGILISPQASGTTMGELPISTDATVIVTNTAIITNDVAVDTTSGSATIVGNETVGNVTTGDAITDVAILNMANNIATTGDVFVGIVTIDGDLNEDIVLSQALLDYLLGSSGTHSALLSPTNVTTSNLAVIANDVTALAHSGTITSEKNESTGDATTGDAHTFVIIKNAVGNYILYGNSLLIIVSVTGQWNGTLLGLNGTTAVLQNGQDNQPVMATMSDDTDSSNLTITNNAHISNTVVASATSGNITARYNEDVGNIQTGDATTRVQIINAINNIVSFSNWLGVLFINIFGNWNGSVVMQVLNNPIDDPVPVAQDVEEPVANPVAAAVANSTPGHLFRALFRPSGGGVNNPIPTDDQPIDATAVLAAADTPHLPLSFSVHDSSSWLWLLIVALLSGGLVAGNRVYMLRQ